MICAKPQMTIHAKVFVEIATSLQINIHKKSNTLNQCKDFLFFFFPKVNVLCLQNNYNAIVDVTFKKSYSVSQPCRYNTFFFFTVKYANGNIELKLIGNHIVTSRGHWGESGNKCLGEEGGRDFE